MNFEYKVKILENHLDTFGHINNATYLSLYEEARWDFIEKNGWGLSEIMAKKQGPVLLEANIKYKREIKNRQNINIVTSEQWIKGKIMGLTQQMINEQDQVCSEAKFVIGFMDMKERKLITPPASWLLACGLSES